MTEVIVVATFDAKPGKEEQGGNFLAEMLAPTHENESCLLFALHRGTDDPGRFAFVERWTSREALQASYDTPEFAELMQEVTKYFEGPPAITIYEPVPGGMEGKGSIAGASNH